MDGNIFFAASTLGTLAFALSGYLQGVRKELDIMGLFIVAFLTANGGGLVRDIMIGGVPNVLKDISAFYLVFITCIAAYLLKLHKYTRLERQMFFVVSDSLGLVSFSITGAVIAIENGLSPFGVMVLSIITALGGGVVRDTILGEIPALFNSEFYGSVALLIALMMIGLNEYYELNNITLSAVFVMGFVIRMIAYKYNWHLPKIRKG
ncbi:MAG: hypothetical protein COV35_08905 [Alphaproteobacteria bacterium CG11_big_fil_rev_8_21_14_0_20_39_49]|nr:MAG: hypothetical protein COV35_08905 [Alphaproteobacteria bacterium CG11_big_fil_rev_8_21_14_0_20_39_49]